MNLAAGLMTGNLQKDRAPINSAAAVYSGGAAMVDDGEETRCDQLWKRLVIQLKIVILHALTGSTLKYMETLRERLKKEAEEAYIRAGGTVNQPDAKKKSKHVVPPLPQSQVREIPGTVTFD